MSLMPLVKVGQVWRVNHHPYTHWTITSVETYVARAINARGIAIYAMDVDANGRVDEKSLPWWTLVKDVGEPEPVEENDDAFKTTGTVAELGERMRAAGSMGGPLVVGTIKAQSVPGGGWRWLAIPDELVPTIEWTQRVAPRPGQRRKGNDGNEFDVIDYDARSGEPWLIRDHERALRRLRVQDMGPSVYVSGPTKPETKREELERVARLEMGSVPDGWTKGQWEAHVLALVESCGRLGGVRGEQYLRHDCHHARRDGLLAWQKQQGINGGRTGSLRPTRGR